MNPVLSLALAVLVYPGLLAALVAAGVLGWLRATVRGALSGASLVNPLAELGELRLAFQRETIPPDGVHPAAVTLLTATRLICPLLALVLLPVPGNPLASAIGLPGDLAAEGALLFGAPLARIALGWAIPAAAARLTADHEARLLAGATIPAAFALAAAAQLGGSLIPIVTKSAKPIDALTIVSSVLAAAAFACALPVLARRTTLAQDDAEEALSDDTAELTGQDLVYSRIAEALQLVAVAGLFVAAFVLPPLHGVDINRPLLWALGTLLTVAGIGAWEGIATQGRTSNEQPPLSWWLGIPLLLGLAALVATAWATRT